MIHAVPSIAVVRHRSLTGDEAWFSPCGSYRYLLTRKVGPGDGVLIVIGLNPSTADHEQDDPTIRRCKAFAAREGLGTLRMLNLFAFRSTNPAALREVADPVGPENDSVLTTGQTGLGLKVILAAWGAHGDAFTGRVKHVLSLLYRPVSCLGTTKSGQPAHPLYLRADAPLVPWRAP